MKNVTDDGRGIARRKPRRRRMRLGIALLALLLLFLAGQLRWWIAPGDLVGPVGPEGGGIAGAMLLLGAVLVCPPIALGAGVRLARARRRSIGLAVAGGAFFLILLAVAVRSS